MNPMRRPLIAGNWKMNQGGAGAPHLAAEVATRTVELDAVDVLVAPPFTALTTVAKELSGTKVHVAAQNMHAKDSGAFTGEVSAPMILETGAKWVIIGHSERRQYFGETDGSVGEKVAAALAKKLRPIVCIGETLEQREQGKTLAVVGWQLDAFVKLLAAEPGYGVVAYEPVWAIGTGRVATPEQAQEVHAAIRARLTQVNAEVGAKTLVLYGGSMKASNAAGLLSQADIDGGLVGGAALDAADFSGIAKAAQDLAKKG